MGERVDTVLTVIVLAITTLMFIALGFLVMARGRNALSDLRWLIGGGAGGLVSLALSMFGILPMLYGAALWIVGLVIAWRAHRLERRLIEQRARRIGRGGAGRH